MSTLKTSGIRRPKSWPVLLLAAPAFVAIWSGWVGLGSLTGFGKVHPLPGIWNAATIDTAITLPIGVETYAAYALHIWLSHTVSVNATRFAKWSALGSLALGAGGQVAYHLMVAAGMTSAPWQITALVACLPVAVLGMGAALAHLVTDTDAEASPAAEHDTSAPVVEPAAVEGAGGEAEQDAPQASVQALLLDEAEDGPEPVEDVTPAPRPAPRPAPPAAASSPAISTPAARRVGRPAGTPTAVTVTRLRAKHPAWTVGQIAAKAGVSERTARRHLNATTAPGSAAPDLAA